MGVHPGTIRAIADRLLLRGSFQIPARRAPHGGVQEPWRASAFLVPPAWRRL